VKHIFCPEGLVGLTAHRIIEATSPIIVNATENQQNFIS
jgi:hypothetical protein